MNYRLLILFLFIFSCTTLDEKKVTIYEETYSNYGFVLVFEEKYYKNKKVTNLLENRSLKIYQKNLKKDSYVKITNLLNNKSIIAQVGNDSLYPNFYNAVISKRISEELNLNVDEPYVQIKLISQNSTFVAKKAKTFDEEKNVANKAPVEDISIKSLSNSKSEKKSKNKNKSEFNYIIKIGDFYFKNTANLLKNRIKNDFNINHVKIRALSQTKYRVYLGPFKDLNSLKKGFNDISKLDFENIEILKL